LNRTDHQTAAPARSNFHGYAQEAGIRQSTDCAAHVATFQITPTIRPRAFPRTNPSYVGTYRRDRSSLSDRTSLYKRVDTQPSGFGSGNSEQGWKPFFEFPSNPSSSNGCSRRPISDGAVAVQQVLSRVSESDAFWPPSGQYTGQPSSHFTPTGADVVGRTNLIHRPHSDGIVTPRYPTVVGKNSHSVSSRDGMPSNDNVVNHETVTTRRKSEPDYVNVSRNADRHSKASISSFSETRNETAAVQGGLNTSALGRLSPNAVYVNQQELAMSAFSSRSACSFLEPITDGMFY
jgi:hypothetical protein